MEQPKFESPSTRKSVVSTPATLCSIEEARDEVERELQVRHRCYDRWVAEGKLTHSEATRRYQQLYTAVTMLDMICKQGTAKLTVLPQQESGPQPETT